jgi:uncharacterized protein (TIGR00251 family)
MSETQVAVTAAKAGTLVPVRVKPRGRANIIEGVRNGMLLVSVTAAPTEGAANAAVIEVLAAALGWPKSQVHIERGHKSREKIICLSSLSAEEVCARLASEEERRTAKTNPERERRA